MKLDLEEPRKFIEVLIWYTGKKIKNLGSGFEWLKNQLVNLLLYKRGRFSKIFLHGGMVFIIAGVLVSAPILASNYPVLGIETRRVKLAQASSSVLRTDVSDIETKASEKPRDQVVEHRVSEGETLSSVARDYGVSMDSIKWLNTDVTDFETLSLGQVLKIPPVSGIVHTVESGDTVYTLAKTYQTNAQKIVDFPFNKFANDETFDLVVGQDLIIPDGVQPEAAPYVPQPEFIAQYGTPVANGNGMFTWPTQGVISQYFGWYHTGLDIANPGAPMVTAAADGRVALVEISEWGYGHHIILDHGNGYQTLYGHLQQIFVSMAPGANQVTRGQVIGQMGSTGRSTGTHLHFEVRYNGVFQDPLGYLK